MHLLDGFLIAQTHLDLAMTVGTYQDTFLQFHIDACPRTRKPTAAYKE